MEKIINIYHYLYYRSYVWYRDLTLFGKNTTPEYSAASFLSLRLFINIITILPWVIGFNLFLGANKAVLIVILGLWVLLNFKLLAFNNQYKKIYEKFKNESPEDRKKRGVYVMVYNILTFVFLILSPIIGSLVK